MYHSCISENYYDKYKQYLLWANGEGWIGKQKNQFNDKFERVRFIVLSGEEYFEDGYMDDEGISDVIDHLIEQEYEAIVNCLIGGIGSKKELLDSLKYTFKFDEECDREKLSVWQENDFSRHYL